MGSDQTHKSLLHAINTTIGNMTDCFKLNGLKKKILMFR